METPRQLEERTEIDLELDAKMDQLEWQAESAQELLGKMEHSREEYFQVLEELPQLLEWLHSQVEIQQDKDKIMQELEQLNHNHQMAQHSHEKFQQHKEKNVMLLEQLKHLQRRWKDSQTHLKIESMDLQELKAVDKKVEAMHAWVNGTQCTIGRIQKEWLDLLDEMRGPLRKMKQFKKTLACAKKMHEATEEYQLLITDQL